MADDSKLQTAIDIDASIRRSELVREVSARRVEALHLLAWAFGLGVPVYVALWVVAEMLMADAVPLRVASLAFTVVSFANVALGVATALGLARLVGSGPRIVGAGLGLGAAALFVAAATSMAMDVIAGFEVIRDGGAAHSLLETLHRVRWPLAAIGCAAVFGGLALCARAAGHARGALALLVVGGLAVVDVVADGRLPGAVDHAGDALRVLVPFIAALVLLRAARHGTSRFARARRAVHLLVAAIAGRVAFNMAGVAVLALASRPPPQYEAIAFARAAFPAASALLGVPLLCSLVQLARVRGRARLVLVAAALVFACAWLVELRIVWLEIHEHLEGGLHGWIQREIDLLAPLSLIGGALAVIALAIGLSLLGDPALRRRAYHLAAAAACATGLALLLPAWPVLTVAGLWAAAAFVATMSRASALFGASAGQQA